MVELRQNISVIIIYKWTLKLKREIMWCITVDSSNVKEFPHIQVSWREIGQQKFISPLASPSTPLSLPHTKQANESGVLLPVRRIKLWQTKLPTHNSCRLWTKYKKKRKKKDYQRALENGRNQAHSAGELTWEVCNWHGWVLIFYEASFAAWRRGAGTGQLILQEKACFLRGTRGERPEQRGWPVSEKGMPEKQPRRRHRDSVYKLCPSSLADFWTMHVWVRSELLPTIGKTEFTVWV